MSKPIDVALTPTTTAETLAPLAKCRDWRVLAAVLNHPNITKEILNDVALTHLESKEIHLFSTIITHKLADDDTLRIVAKSTDWAVLHSLASTDKTPKDVIEALLTHSHKLVREKAAKHPSNKGRR